MPSSIQGFLRGLGVVVIFAVIEYVGAHIGTSGLVSNSAATIIASLCLAAEHVYNGTTNTA